MCVSINITGSSIVIILPQKHKYTKQLGMWIFFMTTWCYLCASTSQFRIATLAEDFRECLVCFVFIWRFAIYEVNLFQHLRFRTWNHFHSFYLKNVVFVQSNSHFFALHILIPSGHWGGGEKGYLGIDSTERGGLTTPLGLTLPKSKGQCPCGGRPLPGAGCALLFRPALRIGRSIFD